LAALAVISSIISLPSSSVCGLKMAWVARRGEDVLNGWWRGGCGAFVESGVRRAVVGKGLGLVVFVEYVLVLAAYVRAGTRRSRIGAAAWRRMLSWMKREAVEGGLMQGRGGIAMRWCRANWGPWSFSLGRRVVEADGWVWCGVVHVSHRCGGMRRDAKFRHDVRRNSGLGGRPVGFPG
jgi:hypothetical protein